MQLIRTTKEEIGWATLNHRIKAGEFQKGDEIEINGSLWRVLDTEENGIFIWKHSGPGEIRPRRIPGHTSERLNRAGDGRRI